MQEMSDVRLKCFNDIEFSILAHALLRVGMFLNYGIYPPKETERSKALKNLLTEFSNEQERRNLKKAEIIEVIIEKCKKGGIKDE